MSQQIFWILLSFCLVSCGSVTVREQKLTDNTVQVDVELLKKSDYIDIVFEDGIYSYLSYLKEEKINNASNKSFTCPEEKNRMHNENGNNNMGLQKNQRKGERGSKTIKNDFKKAKEELEIELKHHPGLEEALKLYKQITTRSHTQIQR